jgi:2-methylcitrate dehydratase PrpD
MSLTRTVSRFVVDTTLASVPQGVAHLAKRSILDGIGLAVAGAQSAVHRIARAHIEDAGCSSQATLLGTGVRSSERYGAFANGLAIHADDYDDTQLAESKDRVYGLLTHPTAPALPAALAFIESRGGSGRDLLTAYLAGVEVECKIAEAIHPRHYQDGFHTTGTVGALGAGAAAAEALGLDEERTAVALGLAASQSAGLRENFGTMTTPFHAGRAAESGSVAADLSQRGMSAADTILEAPRGFFQAAGGGYEPALIEGRLGDPWTFDHPGVSIKPHPCGSLTHPGMCALLELIREHDVKPDDVHRVTVGTNSNMPNALIHHRPANELQAKFSMEFCMAILLLERRAGLAEFTDEVVNRADVQELIRRVEFGTDPEAEAHGYDTMTTIIRVDLTDGRQLETRGVYGKGHPQNQMSDAELVDKFLECLDWGGVPEATGREVAERVLALEAEPSVAELVGRLEGVRVA